MNDCGHISVHMGCNEYSTKKFKCSLSSALAEGKGTKDMMD
jgi:hypothetical protein